MAKTGPSVRYHFSAPESDTQIAEWVALQHNFSTSMRILIKDYIAKYGMQDIACLPLTISDDIETKAVVANQPVAEAAEVVDENVNTNTPRAAEPLDDMLASIMK